MIKTPFDKAICPTHSGDFAATTGGVDLPDAPPKETPNTVSGLPLQTTTVQIDGAPAANSQIPEEPITPTANRKMDRR